MIPDTIVTYSPSARETRMAEFFRIVVALFKLRVVALLLFAGAGGALFAAGAWPGFAPLTLMTLTGGLAAMGASALNQYLEQSRDALMRRTQRRPLVTGAIGSPGWVLPVAVALIVLPSLAVLPFNPALAFWSLAGAVIYVGVYTVWLKPRTVLNIVIGGLAGTCAVLSGGAAVGNWTEPGVLVLGLLVLLWTPTHFWSLALWHREDYVRARVPMLPAITSPRRAALGIAWHTAATGIAALALGAHPMLGWLYLLPTALATLALVWHSIHLLARPTAARARSLFLYSNLYLAVILLMIFVDALI